MRFLMFSPQFRPPTLIPVETANCKWTREAFFSEAIFRTAEIGAELLTKGEFALENFNV